MASPVAAIAIFALWFWISRDVAIRPSDTDLAARIVLGAAIYGFVLALVFGGIALGVLILGFEPRRPPARLYPVAGVLAASAYVLLGFTPVGIVLAPWRLLFLLENAQQAAGPVATACVLAAGAFGGWLYERGSRP